MTGAQPGEVVIDLGMLAAGTPPPPAPPAAWRPRRLGARGRAVALLAVVAAGLALPGADARADGGPVLHLGSVPNVLLGDGVVYLETWTRAGALDRLEARDTASGRLRWAVDLEQWESAVAVATGVVVLGRPNGSPDGGYSLLVRDGRTGAPLWRRDGALILGAAGGLVLLQDGWPAGPSTEALPGLDTQPADTHVFGVDARTGAEAWTVAVPAGAALSFASDKTRPYELAWFADLRAGGELRTYDVATGRVTRTDRLAVSGPAAAFTVGDAPGLTLAPGSRAGQVLVSVLGRPGAPQQGDVPQRVEAFDRATGRLLWSRDAARTRVFACAPGRWCQNDTGGIAALDAPTGREVWRADGFDTVLGGAGDTVVLAGRGLDNLQRAELLLVDGRTGAPRARVEGWHGLTALGGAVVVWRRAAEERDTTLGILDPATGRIAVFGHGDSWAGQPRCATDGRVVGCIPVGDLTVWRLPAVARR
ncbi:PQQ-binding-like beta-propeller repeat protein [Dactylosporangium sp. CA-092794]|uniref:outer membrane protein assembly factor BamB family protein n=1 Tax=Dactylosporangium sp. CA-092794 TaxID=3239929 RepID=UPI003D8FFBFE